MLVVLVLNWVVGVAVRSIVMLDCSYFARFKRCVVLAQGNQIRLVNKALQCEAIYYLAGVAPDPARISNRMLKHNTTIYAHNPADFLAKNIVADFKAVPSHTAYHPDGSVKRTSDYHGELSKLNLQSTIRNFCAEIEKELPNDYEFHQLGVCMAEKADAKGKFGNIEIKYRPKGPAFVVGHNPDRMVVVNIHVRPLQAKHTESLVTDSIKKGAKTFLGKVKNLFQHADLDNNFASLGFKASEHSDTTANLVAYREGAAARMAHVTGYSAVLFQLKAQPLVVDAAPEP
jgi:hypothetical protein